MTHVQPYAIRTLIASAVSAWLAAGVGCQSGSEPDDRLFRFREDGSEFAGLDGSGPGSHTRRRDAAEGAPTGAPCRSATDCAGNHCLDTESYPGGYCTRSGCVQGQCAGRNAVCVRFGNRPSHCLEACRSPEECRDGYECRSAGRTERTYCLPPDAAPRVSFEQTRDALGVRCQPERVGGGGDRSFYRFQFELGTKTKSFLMVPFANSGRVRPVRMTTPRGGVNLRDEYRHHNTRLSHSYGGADVVEAGTFGEIAFDWPVVVPYAPRFENYAVAGGTYELRVQSEERRPCLYVLEKRAGRTLDLNFYLVGAAGLSPKTAGSDEDFQEALAWMDRLFDDVGIGVGTIRYFGVPDHLKERFEVVTGRKELLRLTAQGAPPGPTLSAHLSIDIFLVNDLRLENQSGQSVSVLGLSPGIPGAAGMHGNIRDGLVFQTSDLGFDNRHVGLIMAHEIGHFLGLRHTTEVFHGTDQGNRIDQLYGDTDPIDDTQICSDIARKARENPQNCPDFDNLMFPVAPSPEMDQRANLTSGQGKAIRANPVITDR